MQAVIEDYADKEQENGYKYLRNKTPAGFFFHVLGQDKCHIDKNLKDKGHNFNDIMKNIYPKHLDESFSVARSGGP